MKKFLLTLSALLLCVSAFSQETGSTGTVTSKGNFSSQGVSSSPDFKVNLALPDPRPFSEEKMDSVYYFTPSIRFDETPLVLNPNHVPFIRDYSTFGVIGSWNGFHLFGSGSYSEHPFLVTTRNATIGVARRFGPVYVTLYGEANHYAGMPLYSVYQFGIGGEVTYRISPALSVTGFANVYNVNPMMSHAAYAFMNTSSYGGYLTIQGDRLGVDLGAKRYYDPRIRGWDVAPIVTPKFKVGEVEFSIPVGGLIKSQMDNMNYRSHQPPPPPPPAPEPQRRHW